MPRSSVNAMNAYRGTRGIAPFILNIDTKWRLVVKFTPRSLYSRERNSVTTEYEASVEVLQKRKMCCPLPEFEPRIVQPVAQSLYRLSCRGSSIPARCYEFHYLIRQCFAGPPCSAAVYQKMAPNRRCTLRKNVTAFCMFFIDAIHPVVYTDLHK
jgi:hypothetical protein